MYSTPLAGVDTQTEFRLFSKKNKAYFCSMSTIDNMKQALAATIRSYHQKGWSPATSTNYSFRQYNTDDVLFVSRSGVDKSEFQANDFLIVDFEGNPTAEFASVKPSAETLIHCVLYQLFPDAQVILHSHSPYSVLMSQRVDDQLSFAGYEIQKGFAGQTTHDAEVRIPVLDNSQDMQQFVSWMKARKDELSNHCFVIRNHGTYAWGNSLFEAKRHLETLEYLLQVAYMKQA